MSEYRPTKPASDVARAAHGGLTCWEFDNFIVDYLEEKLTSERRMLFEAHLRTCPPCKRYLDDYIRAGKAARKAYTDDPAPEDAPPDMINAIMRAVRDK